MYKSNLRYSSSRNRTRSSGAPRRSGPGKQYINPAKLVRAAKVVVIEDEFIPLHNFIDFPLDELLQQNIAAKGYITPSPIQDQTIPIGLRGRDVVGIANTGTGKTAAFVIPIIQQIIVDPRKRALIIAPTRELAQQIEVECRDFGKGTGLKGAVLIGGSSMSVQLRDLREKPNVVIGTPGRLKDHVERGSLPLDMFSIVVLDEVDRMVDMGFITDIRYLLAKLASPRQALFFSATIEPKIESLIHSFMDEPETVSVKTGETSENVEQAIIEYQHTGEKFTKLHDLLIQQDVAKTLIFDDTQRSVERLSKELQERGFKADAIHGGKSQGHRERALKKFRDNQVNILVATDVAARGIDVADITHVVNFSMPNNYEDYSHRIGRAGRAGRIGYAVTFVNT